MLNGKFGWEIEGDIVKFFYDDICLSLYIYFFWVYSLIGTGRVRMKMPKRAQSPPRTFPNNK
jgi:hypothetical protein